MHRTAAHGIRTTNSVATERQDRRDRARQHKEKLALQSQGHQTGPRPYERGEREALRKRLLWHINGNWTTEFKHSPAETIKAIGEIVERGIDRSEYR